MTARRTPTLHAAMLALVAVLGASFAPRPARAQESVLPSSPAELLLDAGRWREAEDLLYADARTRPRDPIARARLGRYLAMKGALRPGLVLIEEAAEFGLPSATARSLAAPIHTLLDWRERASYAVRDSIVHVRPPSSPEALLRLPLVRSSARDTVWAELVPRMVGMDSAWGSSPRIGIETLDAQLPAFDVANHVLRLNADPRAALGAVGRRYPVLRSEREVRVLLGPGRVRPLALALRELTPRWWQLDLLHGVLVVQ